ncbi:MAG: hypothetical protein HN402_10400 [Candidatus Scalindua sp.]|jgi:hypothetical protein|nr:hypothetical protein [Candidatus Scalindua sp.]
MKLIARITTLFGIVISGIYLISNGWNFAGITALLSFSAAFAATFIFSSKTSVSMSQKTGNNSTAYQSGHDINIKE